MNKKSFGSQLLAAPHIVWSVLFTVVPLFIMLYFAFTNADGVFTLENIKQIGLYKKAFGISILYAVIATLITLLIAYPMAYFMTKVNISSQRMLMMIVMIPMWMNFLIRTYSWITILANTGIINTLLKSIGLGPVKLINTPGAVILGMVYDFLPYMILPIYSVLSKLDNRLLEASSDLGANGFTTLKKVIIPLSMPGVVSGITMVFVPSVSTFYISQKLGGIRNELIGDVIEQQFKLNSNYNLGASLSLILMVMIIISLAVMNRFTAEDDGGVIV